MNRSLAVLHLSEPCHKEWDGMTPVDAGGEVRHCSECSLNVFNLSSMTDAEVRAFFASRQPGERTCGQMLVNPDGSLATRDSHLRVSRGAAAWLPIVTIGTALALGGVARAEQGCGVGAEADPAPPVAERMLGDVQALPASPAAVVVGGEIEAIPAPQPPQVGQPAQARGKMVAVAGMIAPPIMRHPVNGGGRELPPAAVTWVPGQAGVDAFPVTQQTISQVPLYQKIAKALPRGTQMLEARYSIYPPGMPAEYGTAITIGTPTAAQRVAIHAGTWPDQVPPATPQSAHASPPADNQTPKDESPEGKTPAGETSAGETPADKTRDIQSPQTDISGENSADAASADRASAGTEPADTDAAEKASGDKRPSAAAPTGSSAAAPAADQTPAAPQAPADGSDAPAKNGSATDNATPSANAASPATAPATAPAQAAKSNVRMVVWVMPKDYVRKMSIPATRQPGFVKAFTTDQGYDLLVWSTDEQLTERVMQGISPATRPADDATVAPPDDGVTIE